MPVPTRRAAAGSSSRPDGEAIHVIIADDHDVVRRGLPSLLDTVDDICVIAEAAIGTEAIGLAAELVPDVMLLDLQMPNGHGIDATRQITADHPNVAVVILTMFDDADSIDAALRGHGSVTERHPRVSWATHGSDRRWSLATCR